MEPTTINSRTINGSDRILPCGELTLSRIPAEQIAEVE